MSGRPVPSPSSNRPSVSSVSECASHASIGAVRNGEAYTQVPTRSSGASAAAVARTGAGAGCHPGTSGTSSVA